MRTPTPSPTGIREKASDRESCFNKHKRHRRRLRHERERRCRFYAQNGLWCPIQSPKPQPHTTIPLTPLRKRRGRFLVALGMTGVGGARTPPSRSVRGRERSERGMPCHAIRKMHIPLAPLRKRRGNTRHSRARGNPEETGEEGGYAVAAPQSARRAMIPNHTLGTVSSSISLKTCFSDFCKASRPLPKGTPGITPSIQS